MARAFSANVTATTGAHTLHVKVVGKSGRVLRCRRSHRVWLSSAAAAVPANALVSNGIHALEDWQASYDTATGSGSATGTMSLVTSPSVSGTAREFLTTYTNYGGERYSILFGTDSSSTNFLFDTRIYVASPNNDIANVEMDLNQVMPNGQTVIFGFQCDGWSGTWDYTVNAGTPQKPVDQWLHSTASCNPRSWTTNTWHHVQISYSRDNAGNRHLSVGMVRRRGAGHQCDRAFGVRAGLGARSADQFPGGWQHQHGRFGDCVSR